MSINEKVYKMHKQHIMPVDIAYKLGIGFKEVMHMISNKPAKTLVNGKHVRVFK